MEVIMQLSQIISHDVKTISPEASIRDAAMCMREADIGALPVCDGQKLVGMITDRDIAVRAIAQGEDPEQCRVSDAMTSDVIYCYEDEDVEQAVKIMEQKQLRRLPIVNRDKQLVGILAQADIARTGRDEMSGNMVEKVSQPGGPMQ
jgi:CBS domain-containing protein